VVTVCFGTNQIGFISLVSDRRLASFSFWPLVQPFFGLLQHATEGRSDRAAVVHGAQKFL